MSELSPQICSYILADKSRYAYGADEIYEMSGMWEKKLAEKSSDKRHRRLSPKSSSLLKVPSAVGSFLSVRHQVGNRYQFL